MCISLLGAVQASYLLGLSLRKQIKLAEASKHLEIALDAAYEAQDSIRDEIWRELAACKYAWWSSRAQVRANRRARMQTRLRSILEEHYKACPSVRPCNDHFFSDPCRAVVRCLALAGAAVY